MKKRSGFAHVVTYISLIVLGTAFTLPFFWMLTTSLKPDSRIQQWPPDIIPMLPVTAKINGKNREVRKTADGSKEIRQG